MIAGLEADTGKNGDNNNIDDESPQVPLAVADVVAVQIDTVETVEVMAPSDLPAGYHLDVVLQQEATGNVGPATRSLRVEVPQGGVRSGELFQGIVIVSDLLSSPASSRPQNRSVSDHVPIGEWRDGLLECFQFGFCHPLLCLTFWAAPVSLGQIMTRENLNACAEPQENGKQQKCCSTFQTMLSLFAFSVFASIVLGQIMESVCVEDDDDDDGGEKEPGWVLGIRFSRVGISFFYVIFFCIVAIRTRTFVRTKYKIPSRCGECEDVCCVLFCYSCSLCQIARHTVDYKNIDEEASCCSETGLRNVRNSQQ